MSAKLKTEPEKKYAYRFWLKSGKTGTYLTDEPNLDEAQKGLRERYGARLLLVMEGKK